MRISDATARPRSPFTVKGERTYLEPAGDPGLYGPDSMAWRVHANPVALAVGGIAAVILELAEPRVRSGVWDHSSFRSDPLIRMQRTAEAAMMTTFGPTAAAEARIEMVNRMHARISGVTPEGQAYTALDPELLEWVHLTAGYGFLNAYIRYVDPRLSRADQDRYYREGARSGRAFGAADPPTSVMAAEARMEAMRPKLQQHPIIDEFLQIVSTASPLGLPGRPLQALLVRAAIDLLPPSLRRELQLPERPLAGPAVHVMMRGLAAAAQMAPTEIVRQAHARVGRTPSQTPWSRPRTSSPFGRGDDRSAQGLLIVCPFSEVPRLCLDRRPSHLLTLLSPESDMPDVPTNRAPVHRLSLAMDDIAEKVEGLIAPDEQMVAALLNFTADWTAEAPLLVHCWAGVSRSTAAAFAIACQKRPDLDEAVVAAALRRASPYATPNGLIVALADRLMQRNGRMIEAAQAIGRGSETPVGRSFEMPLHRLG